MERKTEKLAVSVLYVEDEHIVREPFAEMLSRRVQTLYLATNGKEGLDAFHVHKPDIVITDIKMPVMDGLTMVAHIRETDRQVPVIITTAFEFKDYLKKSIEVGVNKYLVKPIDRADVEQALAEMTRLVEFQKVNRDYQEFLELMLNTSNRIIILAEFPEEVIFLNSKFLSFFGFSSRDEFMSKFPDVFRFFESIHHKTFTYDSSGDLAWIDGFMQLNGVQNNTFINYTPDQSPGVYNLTIHVFSSRKKVALILNAI